MAFTTSLPWDNKARAPKKRERAKSSIWLEGESNPLLNTDLLTHYRLRYPVKFRQGQNTVRYLIFRVREKGIFLGLFALSGINGGEEKWSFNSDSSVPIKEGNS